MKLKELFTSIYSLIIFLLISLCVVSVFMYLNNKKMIQSSIKATNSFQIADELKQSSDELTKYCRIYVVTGDSIWEEKYKEILDIRNGIRPRQDGRTIALRDSMRQLGFTEAEFAKLEESEKKSNRLALHSETIAFNAMKGLFTDSTGIFSIHKTPDPAMARSIMFGKTYEYNKTNIMKPINEFILMVKNRTQDEVDKYEKFNKLFIVIVLGLIFIISFISIASYFLIKTKIIKQLEELQISKTKAEESEKTLKIQNEILDKKVEVRTNDLKEKNKELAKNEEKLRSFINHAGDTIVMFDSEFNISDVNDAGCKLTGYTRNELLGKNVLNLIPEQDYMDFAKKKVLLNTQGATINERKLKRKDGKLIDTEVNSRALEGMGYIIIIRDITERKRTELLLQSILDHSPENIILLDKDYKIICFNEVIKKTLFLYFNRNIKVGDDYRDFVVEHHMEEFLESFNKSISGESVSMELETKGNGFSIWFIYNLSPVYSQTGELIGVSLSAKNISEEKQAAILLEESELKFRNLAEQSAAGVYITHNKKVTYVNPKLAEIFGYNEEELKKIFKTIGIDSKDNSEFANKSTKTKEDGVIGFNHYESKATRKDGQEIWTDVYSSATNYNGIKTIIGTVIDITNRKKAQNELIEKNIELQKTNSELDKFVYSVSHDLRSPLTSVLGLINIIDDNTNIAVEDQKEIIGMMRQSIVKLDKFIEDILAYSRNTRIDVATDEISFENLLTDSRQTHKYTEDASGYKLKINIEQNGSFISDRRRIEIILNNLISNAIKYKDNSKTDPFVKISITTNEHNALIEIEDNGIGIEDKDNEKIFQMFYRGTQLSNGSGLGMYIVKETLEKLHGSITVESKIKIGTKFIITIPNLILSNKSL